MIPLFHTRHTEQSAILLSKHYRHVVVNGKHALSTVIRVDRKKLGKEFFIGVNADHAGGQLGLWRERGGMLLNYRVGDFKIPHEAQVFAECPMDMARLVGECGDTLACAVVYWPNSWAHHEHELERIYPSVGACERVLAAIHAAGITSADAAILRALGLPSTGVVAIADDALAEQTGITPRHLHSVVRALVYGSRWENYCWALPIVVRIEPREPGLLGLYRYIEQLPSLNGVRFAVDYELAKVVRNWRVQMRALERCGSVSAKPRMGFYVPSKIELKAKGIAKLHGEARARLQEIIRAVESAPALTQWSLARLQGRSLRRSASGEQSAGAVPAADNPD